MSAVSDGPQEKGSGVFTTPAIHEYNMNKPQTDLCVKRKSQRVAQHRINKINSPCPYLGR